ncbi:hypothetical protein NDU88_000543 [Pleurodeles waltl]|uniref:Uncharacterized protein n=1 Tax=Pleurodeles waltl TaxID=8319 RepID=A0AAV7KQ66_PLEWA|nr:hypothetical protein NDU88_000543 [Pleurodeles waltl]
MNGAGGERGRARCYAARAPGPRRAHAQVPQRSLPSTLSPAGLLSARRRSGASLPAQDGARRAVSGRGVGPGTEGVPENHHPARLMHIPALAPVRCAVMAPPCTPTNRKHMLCQIAKYWAQGKDETQAIDLTPADHRQKEEKKIIEKTVRKQYHLLQ